MAVFAWGKLRHYLVALGAREVGVITGDVPAKNTFSGFTSDVVVIIAAALIISAAVAKSGVLEIPIRPTIGRLLTPRGQVPALAGATLSCPQGLNRRRPRDRDSGGRAGGPQHQDLAGL